MRFHLTRESGNHKTGPIPVSTTSFDSCPSTCSLRPDARGACYAGGGPLGIFWRKVSDGRAGQTLRQFCKAVKSLPAGQLWRLNQAGDLPGKDTRIDGPALRQIVEANRGKRGFTFTHKPVLSTRHARNNRRAIEAANRSGFTVNLSADNLVQADQLKALGIAPVVTVLPDTQNTNLRTPDGNLVVICPATQSHKISCGGGPVRQLDGTMLNTHACKLCAWKDRDVIIGFPAHGSRRKKIQMELPILQ